MKSNFTAVILLLILCTNSTLAQQYPFVQYTPKDGLINSRVRNAYQDSKGRMYFITYGGLSMYDGTRFRNYSIQNGLAMDLVNDILEVGDDSLLIATNTGTINTLVNGKIGSLKTENDFCPLVNHFLRGRDGSIYISSDHGLFQLKGNRFEEFPLPEMITARYHLPFLGYLIEHEDYLLFSTNDLRYRLGLYLYDKLNRKIVDIINNISITYLGKDNNGRIWISGESLMTLDPAALKKGKLKLIPFSPPDMKSKIAYSVMGFDGRYAWALWQNKQLLSFNDKGINLIIDLPTQAGNSVVSQIFIDREKCTWLCLDGAGVLKLVPPRIRIPKSPLGENNTSFLYSAKNFGDTTWFNGFGDHIFRKTSSSIQKFYSNIQSFPFLFHQDKEHLFVADNKNIYEARLPDSRATRIHFQKVFTLDSNTLGHMYFIDPYGSIIAATSRHLIVLRRGKIVDTKPLNSLDALEGIVMDNNRRIWLAFRFSDLVSYELRPDDTSGYLQNELRFQLGGGNESISPRSITMDRNGLIWVGTRYDGLLAYKYENNELVKKYHFNTGNGLTDNFVISLASDSASNVFAGTATGFDQLIKTGNKSYRVENLTKSGNLFLYITQVWVDGRNRAFALANTGSLLEVIPFSSQQPDYRPMPILDEIRINGKASPLDLRQIPFSRNNLSISVAAPTFLDEKQVKFSYLLEGANNSNWSDTSAANSTINLINLAAGTYHLRVKAFFPSTPYEPVELRHSFEILPPWWKNWWFRIPMGLLIIVSVLLAIRSYYRRKMRRELDMLEKQQAIERERTRIATDMHDDLGAGLSRIKFLSETIGMKKQQQQPIEEEIGKIREYSHEMIGKMDEIVWALNEKNDTLSDLVAYTRSYAAEYLTLNGIACSAKLPENIPAYFVSGEFRRNVFLSVKESLHNIVKHAQASEVSISFNTDKRLTITVSDNGVGIDTRRMRAFSNGLENMRKRMRELDGRMEIKNTNGTTILFDVPVQL